MNVARDNWVKGLLLGILIAVGGWAVFQLVLSLFKTIMEKIGLINPIFQYIAIIVVIVLVMIVGWHTGLKGAVRKLVR